MTHDDRRIDLTQRKLPIGAGAIGLASAGAGLDNPRFVAPWGGSLPPRPGRPMTGRTNGAGSSMEPR